MILKALTHKWLEMLGCAISTVATPALLLKHQAIHNNCAENNIHCIGPVSYQNITFAAENIRKYNHILKKYTQLFKGYSK